MNFQWPGMDFVKIIGRKFEKNQCKLVKSNRIFNLNDIDIQIDRLAHQGMGNKPSYTKWGGGVAVSLLFIIN